MVVPNTVLGKRFGHVAPSDKMNIAGIGVGGVGRRNLGFMKTENIVALCDVDWNYAAKTFGDFPKAKRFKDWRVMFDEMKDSIDGVLIATTSAAAPTPPRFRKSRLEIFSICS